MELPDPHQSYAVLIGSTTYESPELEDLPAVAGNLRDLGLLLEDPSVWGLPGERCVRIVDPPSAEVLLDAVREAAQRTTDTLLVYYAGHGLMGPEVDSLLLALPSSDPERPYSSVDFASVRREVLGAGRKVNRVVVLDCCYSGQAMVGGMSGSVTMTEQARIAGTYLLTACAENRQALSPPGEPHTAFTGELIRALSDGLPGTGPLIGAPDLYEHLLGELRAKGRPLPQQRLSGTGRTLALARNRHGAGGRTTPATAGGSVRAVPERLRTMLRAQPRLIAEHAERLAATDAPAAEELLTLAAGTRPAQEAAALVYFLRREGRSDDADVVLTAIGTDRAPLDLAAVVPALRAMDDDEDVDRLLRVVARRRAPEDVAGTIRLLLDGEHLGAGDAEALLTAAIATLGTTEAVLGLAGALWSAQLDDQAAAVLRAPAVASPQEAERLAEALRSMGRVKEALDLYLQRLPDVARTPSGLVRILRVADEAGRGGGTDALLRAVARAAPSMRDVAELCDALWAAGMGDRATRTLAIVGGRAAASDVVTLADLLHAQDHDAAVLHLFRQAALHHPVAATPAFVEALRTMGRPLDAGVLLTDAARRPAQELAELLGILHDVGATRDRARLLGSLTGSGPVQRAQLIRLLRSASRPYDDLMDGWCGLPRAEFTRVLGTLHQKGEHEVANLLLRRLATAFPEQAVERMEDVAGVDRAVLRALLAEPGRQEGVSPDDVRHLVAGGYRSLDERVIAIAALTDVGLSAQVEAILSEEFPRNQPHEAVAELLTRLEAQGLRGASMAVVRGADWMFAELYQDFVRVVDQAGLRDLAVYALQCAPHRLTPAQHAELALALGVPAPVPPEPEPESAPQARHRLLDRLRRTGRDGGGKTQDR